MLKLLFAPQIESHPNSCQYPLVNYLAWAICLMLRPSSKKITKMQKNLVKLSYYSAQRLQFWTISFPSKLCVTEKRTYLCINKLKFPIFSQFCCQYPLINYLAWAICLMLRPSSGSSSSSAGWMSILRSVARIPLGSGSSMTAAPRDLAWM